MDADRLLHLARRTIDDTRATGLAITVDRNGDANARTVNTSKPNDDWTLHFMTDRRTRKFGEIERSDRMTMVYDDLSGGSYVSLVGSARIISDPVLKQAIWQPHSVSWPAAGPTDPNAVVVEFTAERIETWNTPEGVVPDPRNGLWAAVLVRDGSGWRYAGSTQDKPFNPR
jgi:general stress protein 26